MGRSHASAKAEVLSSGTGRNRIRTVAAIAVAVLMAVPSLTARGVSAQRQASAQAGAQWIVDNVQPDGSFPQIGGSLAADTGDAIAAAVAGGISGAALAPMLGYIQANGPAQTTQGAYTGRMIAGIVAGGADPKTFGGFDYVAKLTSQYNAGTGAFDPSNAFANLQAANGALAANGSLPPSAVSYILSHECPGPGFGFGFGNACSFGADVDSTALTVNALVAAGFSSDPAVARSRSYLFSKEDASTGLFFGCCGTSTTSTGLGVAMINALGEDAQAAPWRQSPTVDPILALLANQAGDGSFSEPGCGVCTPFATVNIVVGMAGKTYPVRPAPATAATTPSPSPSPSPSPGPGSGSTVDSRAPETSISGAPSRTRDRTPTIQFAADETNVRFECAVENEPFVPCSSPFTVPRLHFGTHIVSVRAIDAAGNVDPTPASAAIKVVRTRSKRR